MNYPHEGSNRESYIINNIVKFHSSDKIRYFNKLFNCNNPLYFVNIFRTACHSYDKFYCETISIYYNSIEEFIEKWDKFNNLKVFL